MRFNQRGATLTELAIVVAIMGVLTLTATAMLVFFNGHLSRAQKLTKGRIDLAVAYRVLWQELSKMGPSFGNLRVADDNGAQFYDYLPDYPEKLLPVAARSRQLTLTAPPSPTSSFIAVLNDDNSPPPMQYDPSWAYQQGESGDPITQDGSLTYQGVNANGIISNNVPNLWVPRTVMMLVSPIAVRPFLAPMQSPPRYVSFFGNNNGTDLIQETAGGVIRTDHPIDGSVINNADAFFRRLPSAGGGTAIALAQRVRIARFSIALEPSTQSMNLIREYLINGRWQEKFTFGTGIRRVTLTRRSVSVPLVTFTIDQQ